jgi:hypothetical protein
VVAATAVTLVRLALGLSLGQLLLLLLLLLLRVVALYSSKILQVNRLPPSTTDMSVEFYRTAH